MLARAAYGREPAGGLGRLRKGTAGDTVRGWFRPPDLSGDSCVRRCPVPDRVSATRRPDLRPNAPEVPRDLPSNVGARQDATVIPVAFISALSRRDPRPETRYARSGDVMVAYQVTGEDNPVDLAFEISASAS